ncbi:hypothetical protein L2E82_49894 [Cichorium intybus]|uniref:Uncharacterized protein n=1 Tax=Cichorium intybus TaxID=13427 RepID=A0ACB8Z2M5_CICIN|nr:hypothetical protein L2E82_49894 [Cichorium intybus]
MNGMNPFSTDQWIQQYPVAAMTESGGERSDDAAIQVHREPTQGTIGQAAPKPTRRRSRASRRTPTTVLNASPTDFRALVQQFTGCDSGVNVGSGSVLAPVVNLPKGPLNINFARKDMSESSSRYTYFDNQLSSPLQGEQMQSVGGFDLQVGYEMENASVVYESIDESTLMATRRDGASHEYHV